MKKMKRPNPYMLGTGSAQQAGSAAMQANRRKKSQLDSIMKEINSDKTGPKKYR